MLAAFAAHSVVNEERSTGGGTPVGRLLPGRRSRPADRDGPALRAARLRWSRGAAYQATPHADHSQGLDAPPEPARIRDLGGMADLSDRLSGAAAKRCPGNAPPRASSSLRRGIPRHPTLARARVQGNHAPSHEGGLWPSRRQGERQLSRGLRRRPRTPLLPTNRAEAAAPRTTRADRVRWLGGLSQAGVGGRISTPVLLPESRQCARRSVGESPFRENSAGHRPRPRMHDIVEFLHRHAPFDDLADGALEGLARSAEVEFFPAGTTIFRQGEGPMDHVRVVRRGAVELVSDGRVLDVLGEGELFGHPSMLSGLPTGFEARAGEGTLCYRLPADAVVPLLTRPAGLRYVARSILARPRPDAAAPGAELDPAAQPVARLVHGRPVIADSSWSVREAARSMAEAEASAALVRLSDRKLGIVTDRDLRDRVGAGEVG